MTNAEFMRTALTDINVLKCEAVAILMIALAELYLFGDYSETVKTWSV